MCMKSVLCVGHANWDVVLHTTEIPEHDFTSPITGEHSSCGGTAVNTALVLSSFGVETKMHGNVGNDMYGDKVEQRLTDTGVKPLLTRSENHPTTVIRAIIEKDGNGGVYDPRYFFSGGENGPFGIEYIDGDVFEDVDHVHVTNCSPSDCGEIAKKAKERGKTVSFNPTQRYVEEACTKIVEHADLIIVNEREYDILGERHDVDELLESGTILVVTQGSAGASIYCHEHNTSHVVGAIPRNGVVDTIGAGDAFVGGLLSEWLVSGDIVEAVKKGNLCGAWAVGEVGAPDTIDTDWVEKNIFIDNS